MKIIDCFTYFDEEIILDLRLNILNSYVDKFVITEGKFDHRGRKRKTIFNIDKFKQFKDKIIYIKVEDFPSLNDPWSMLRHQRNKILSSLKQFNEEDYILISDVDEIPNPKSIEEFFKSQKKIGIFKQKMYYYKFNILNCTESDWFGSKICKKKHLKSPDWLRGLKPKIYPWWRLDKERSIQIINNGGWHFSFLYNPEGIAKKLSSYQHSEFDNSNLNDIEKIKIKIDNYQDIFGREYKYKRVELDQSFPQYLLDNKSKFIEWIKN